MENTLTSYNKNYLKKVSDPESSMNKLNVGCSYLTATMNFGSNKKIQDVNTTAKSFLLDNLDSYKKKFEPKHEAEKKRRKKKTPQEIKIEELKSKFTQNEPGKKINGREMKSPDPVLKNKIAITPNGKKMSLDPLLAGRSSALTST